MSPTQTHEEYTHTTLEMYYCGVSLGLEQLVRVCSFLRTSMMLRIWNQSRYRFYSFGYDPTCDCLHDKDMATLLEDLMP